LKDRMCFKQGTWMDSPGTELPIIDYIIGSEEGIKLFAYIKRNRLNVDMPREIGEMAIKIINPFNANFTQRIWATFRVLCLENNKMDCKE